MMLLIHQSLETWSLMKQLDLILLIPTRQPRQLQCQLLDLVNLVILEDIQVQDSEVSFLLDHPPLPEHPVHVLLPPTRDTNPCQMTIDE